MKTKPNQKRFLMLQSNNRGVAIILVISVLAVLTSLAAAFLISARLETLKAFNFMEGRRASYIAEAGLAHAKRILKEDKASTSIDVVSETWSVAFAGNDIDNDEDGAAEAQWINLVDAAGDLYGRYGVTVIDEAGRVNINTAGLHNEDALKVTEGYSTYEVSLDKLFTVLGLPQATQMRDDILQHRYGGNFPGSAVANEDDNANNAYLSHDGIDNNADGIIDEVSEGINEPQEFVFLYPYGDDRAFFSVFELRNIPSVKPRFSQIKPYVTAYSFDRNIDKNNALRTDVNQATALEIKNAFASAALTSAEQVIVNIVDYRDSDNESTILVSNGKTYYGVEGVRINELMINPRYGFLGTSLTNPTGPGGDWALVGDHYENANPTLDEFGRGVWRFENIRPGTYYLRVFGDSSGDMIGDVKVGGITHTAMMHGEMFINTVVVGQDGRFDVTIYNREVDKGENFTVYFKGFQLVESPDAEYLELINITGNDIDVSGWTVEGLREKDLIATIPAGTSIESFDYLVLAVDKDDASAGVPVNIRNNNISFLNTWNGSTIDDDKVVQLIFSDTLSRQDDIIQNDPDAYSTIIILKTSEQKIVDRIEYFDDYAENIAFERDDPTSTQDKDGDFIFDNWNYSSGFPFFAPVGTPTELNNNVSISGHIIGGINTEIIVKNGAFANVGEIALVSTGALWKTIATSALMKFADKLTTISYRYDGEGHLVQGGGWQEVSRSSPYTNWFLSSSAGDTGSWRFTSEDRFLDGMYFLTLAGKYEEAVAISLLRADGSWTDFTPPLMPDLDNKVRYGIIDVGGTSADALPSKTIEIQIRNESPSGECHFDYIVLSPAHRVDGRININTASHEVLQALPGITQDIANTIVNNRPYGNTYGIGDILSDDILGIGEQKKKEVFRKMGNLITVKSDVYEILVNGQSFRAGKKTAEKQLQVIVER